MPDWLAITRGPVFVAVLALLILGLARHVVFTGGEILFAMRRAGDHRVPYRRLAVETLSWLIPAGRLHRTRPLYSYASFGLHLGVILVALFLKSHLEVLSAAVGVAWPSLPRLLLDALTLIGILAVGYLLAYRLLARNARALSHAMDYLVLALLFGIFVTGYVAGRAWNPIPYDTLMLLHTIAGLALLALIPFTKITHCVLFPLIRFGTEIAWHLTLYGGRDVARTLYGPEGKKP